MLLLSVKFTHVVCVCVYVCVHVSVHVCECACVCVCMHACECVCSLAVFIKSLVIFLYVIWLIICVALQNFTVCLFLWT